MIETILSFFSRLMQTLIGCSNFAASLAILVMLSLDMLLHRNKGQIEDKNILWSN
jgi:hypothetical protein